MELGRAFPDQFGVLPASRKEGLVEFYFSEEAEDLNKALLESIFGRPIQFTSLDHSTYQKLKAELFQNSLAPFPESGFGLDHLVKEALDERGSDVHIEPYGKSAYHIRYRIDGLLTDRYVLSTEKGKELVNAIKVSAGLDIAQRRLPQDGRIILSVEDDASLDLRISIVPTVDAERTVIRLLGQSAAALRLEELGMDAELLSAFQSALSRTKGLVLVSGPTGSGKTTSLYAAINELDAGQLNIMTAEDPVEYFLPGISQTAIKSKIGLDFPEVLRSFLRQDPDVIMIGEIRDEKTAQIAIRAALTGHLVLSTIHTNDSLGTLRRLMDMGIPGYLLEDTIELSIAQRLVRKLCRHCKTNAQSDQSAEAPTPCSANGCPKCNYTGYLGRTAIYEFTTKTDVLTFFNGQQKVKTKQNLSDAALKLYQNGIIDKIEFDRIKWG